MDYADVDGESPRSSISADPTSSFSHVSLAQDIIPEAVINNDSIEDCGSVPMNHEISNLELVVEEESSPNRVVRHRLLHVFGASMLVVAALVGLTSVRHQSLEGTSRDSIKINNYDSPEEAKDNRRSVSNWYRQFSEEMAEHRMMKRKKKRNPLRPKPTIQEKTNVQNSLKKFKNIPVVNALDDKVPGIHEGTAVVDALICRESVLEFVINATDARDECAGLTKAFDTTCSSKSTSWTSSGTESQTRRTLSEKLREKQGRSWDLAWKTTNSLHSFYKRYLKPSPDFLYIENEIAGDSWDIAAHQVAEGTDQSPENRRLAEKVKRFAEELDEMDENQVDEMDENEDEKKRKSQAAKSSVHSLDMEPKMSLTLPTKEGHVSEQMLNDALLLQDGGSNEAISVKITNGTIAMKESAMKESAADAAVSSKAISEASAAVSAVLNDPSSIEARTCCASILNVYHENCDHKDSDEYTDKRLVIVVLVIAFCGIVKSLIRHFKIRWLPEAAGCILVGVLGGVILQYVPHYSISFDGDWFLRIMVPPIVFEAALSIDKKAFNRHVVPILLFAVVGTLLSTLLTALIVNKGTLYLGTWCTTIPFVESLTFGALISSIDPIAVLSVLSNMGLSETDSIYVLIFGESLLNDGVAIVLFETLVHFLDESLVIDAEAVTAATIHFLVVAIGSVFVGVFSGVCCTWYYWAMHECHTPLVEVLMFVCWALLPYYVCDGMEWSGIVAVVATGFVMDTFVIGLRKESNSGQNEPTDIDPFHSPQVTPSNHGSRKNRRMIFSKDGHLSHQAKTHVGFVTQINATMMETAIFAYLGLFLCSSRYHWNFWLSVTAIGACVMSRAIMIPFLTFVANSFNRINHKTRVCRHERSRKNTDRTSPQTAVSIERNGVIIDRKMQVVLWFAGLRGAMSFALVENIPLFDTVTGQGSRLKAELKSMTSASIVFTVFVLGGCTFYLMERLEMTPKKDQNGFEMSPLLLADKQTGKQSPRTPLSKSPPSKNIDSWSPGEGSAHSSNNGGLPVRQRSNVGR
eukprot:CAMPEP_0198295942 /NCGR_PEP_ID=MMETSP1449-20131203/30205_1 /TAXON_ID=420275 /ORGANISM="Attheya septentrionalis, Strain CCMP2084" /LENGTH=1030 /DNA_ID=CAMNT_0043996381 /DNA_START=243 /DNA_END=3335 /DNA_ORIENTATION=-